MAEGGLEATAATNAVPRAIRTANALPPRRVTRSEALRKHITRIHPGLRSADVVVRLEVQCSILVVLVSLPVRGFLLGYAPSYGGYACQPECGEGGVDGDGSRTVFLFAAGADEGDLW